MKGIAPSAMYAGLAIISACLLIAIVLRFLGSKHAGTAWSAGIAACAIFALYVWLDVKIGVGNMLGLYLGVAGAVLFGAMLAYSLNRRP